MRPTFQIGYFFGSQAVNLQVQTPFFEAKTIRIVVGLPASDVYDVSKCSLIGTNLPGWKLPKTNNLLYM